MLNFGAPSGPVYATGTLRVTSTRVAGSGLWVGYADCSWTGSGVLGNSARTPIIFNAADPMMPGSELVVMATIPNAGTAAVNCTVTAVSGTGDPTVQVVVTGASGLSVNQLANGYTTFTGPVIP